MPDSFKSLNLNIEYWSNEYEVPTYAEPYPWRVGIQSIDGVTKVEGFSSMEIFKLKSICR